MDTIENLFEKLNTAKKDGNCEEVLAIANTIAEVRNAEIKERQKREKALVCRLAEIESCAVGDAVRYLCGKEDIQPSEAAKEAFSIISEIEDLRWE